MSNSFNPMLAPQIIIKKDTNRSTLIDKKQIHIPLAKHDLT